MKKALSLILTLTLVTSIFSSTSLYSASAYEEVICEDEFTDNFTNEDNNEICEYIPDGSGGYIVSAPPNDFYKDIQLTDSELQSDTVTLLDLVLKAAVITPGFSNTPIYTGYSLDVQNFNGLQELEKRADASEVMVQRYMEEKLKYSNGFGSTIALSQLDVLLSQDIYKNELTTDDINALKIADACLENQSQWPTVTVLATTATTIIGNVIYTTNGYVQTVSGTNVQVWLAASELDDDYYRYYKDTPNRFDVTELAPPTSKYNCHSYAWHSNSTSNTNWIRNSSISSYINDSQCTLKSISTAQPYDTVVYYVSNNEPKHSGIVKSVSSNGTLTIRSKWGQAGVYQHTLNNVPTDYKLSNGNVDVKVYSYHDYTYISKNAAQHTKRCGICKQSTLQNHVANSTGTGCRYCNYTGAIGGIVSNPGDLETN